MRQKFILPLVLVTFFVALVACDEVQDAVPENIEKAAEVDAKPFMSDSVDVFIAGAVNLTSDQWSACYWKNDSLHVLDENYSVAHDIVFADKEVVVAGKYDGKPCMWKGGKRTMLDASREGEVKAAGFHNGQLYLVGQIYETKSNFRAFVWKDGEITYLNNYKGYASDIAFSGSDVYISGMDSEKPCYWKNGQRTFLSEHFGHGYGLEVIENDVFVGGEYRPADGGYFLGGYWKNGVFQSSGNDCYIWNIGIDRKNKVFLVGNAAVSANADNAMLVSGEEKVALATPDNAMSGANDIAFSLNNQYVLGTCSNGSNSHYPKVCYWLNNKLHRVSEKDSFGKSIYLKPKK